MLKKLMKSTVTVYHKSGEDVNGKGIYERYVLKNVRFERKESVRPSDTGLLPYNSFKLYVNPANCSELIYANKNDHAAMTESARARCWTVKEGDMITVGQTDFSLDNGADEIKKICEVFTVYSVTYDSLTKAEIIEISGRGRMLYQ
ncbi:MAG: hypothetical protein E7477_01775 [Ruminococcaceae bacterium]|nr:hypothetical protein [Oscillospiraceae bacterium]